MRSNVSIGKISDFIELDVRQFILKWYALESIWLEQFRLITLIPTVYACDSVLTDFSVFVITNTETQWHRISCLQT